MTLSSLVEMPGWILWGITLWSLLFPQVKKKLPQLFEALLRMLDKMSYPGIVKAVVDRLIRFYDFILGPRLFSPGSLLRMCLASLFLMLLLFLVVFRAFLSPVVRLVPLTYYHNLTLYFVENLKPGSLPITLKFLLCISFANAFSYSCSLTLARASLRIMRRHPHLDTLMLLITIDLFVALELGGLTLLLAGDLSSGRPWTEYYLRMIYSPGDIVRLLRLHFVVGGWLSVTVLTAALPTLVHMLLAGTAILTKLFRRPLYLILKRPVEWFAKFGWQAITLITSMVSLAVFLVGRLIKWGIIPGNQEVTQGLWLFLGRHLAAIAVILLFLIAIARVQELVERVRKHGFRVFEILRAPLDSETIRQRYSVSSGAPGFLIGFVVKEIVGELFPPDIGAACITLEIEGEATLIDARLVEVFPHGLVAGVVIAESGRKVNIDIASARRGREASFVLLGIGRYDTLRVQPRGEARLFIVRLPERDFFSSKMRSIDKASLFDEFIISGIVTAAAASVFFVERPAVYDWSTLILMTIVELAVVRIRPFFQYVYALSCKTFNRSVLSSLSLFNLE